MNLYSGKFVLRLPSNLHETLAKKAKAEAISLNQLARRLLQESLQNKSSQPAYLEKIKPLLPQIKSHFRKNLLAVLVFGSTVRGETTDKSDIDLLIVLKPTQSIKRSLYHWWESLKKSSSPIINSHFVHLPLSSEQASGIWFEVALDSKLLYQEGASVSGFLKKLWQQIQSGKLERAWSHGHPYWIRRDDAK